MAELEFFFGEKPFMYVHAFKTDSYIGEPEETEEARPEWFSIDSLPYDQMWDDDKYWMPEMFDGKQVEARFRFDKDGDELRDWEIKETDFKPPKPGN